VERPQTYTANDWVVSPDRPDIARGNAPGAQMMMRGEDGIWRIGRTSLGRFGNPRDDPRIKRSAELTAKMELATAGINSGKYATPDDVIKAIYPEGSPMQQIRDAEEQGKKAQEAEQQ